MIATPAHERLLRALDVWIVDEVDDELAEHARAWLATAKHGNAESAAALAKVRAALDAAAVRSAAVTRAVERAAGPAAPAARADGAVTDDPSSVAVVHDVEAGQPDRADSDRVQDLDLRPGQP